MRRYLKHASLSVLAALCLSLPLRGQAAQLVPPRPPLPEGRDTNDADNYSRFGERYLLQRPVQAAAAFYWVTRISPNRAYAWYARYVAALDTMKLDDFKHYLERSKNAAKSPRFEAVDSLVIRAFGMDPFLYRQFETALLMRLVEIQLRRHVRYVDSSLVSDETINVLHDKRAAGFSAYELKQYPAALAFYADWLKNEAEDEKKDAKKEQEHPRMVVQNSRYAVHAERGRLFFLQSMVDTLHGHVDSMHVHLDSARAEMTKALDLLRAVDEKAVVRTYDSKALYEEALALIAEKQGHIDQAREAFRLALQEDLSFYPAHSRLALLELGQHDSTAALSEMATASFLEPGNPVLHFDYGVLLVRMDREDEAVSEFKQAIAADPYYALPYQMMARVDDAHDRKAAAVSDYRTYLQFAARSDPLYDWTVKRISELSATAAAKTP